MGACASTYANTQNSLQFFCEHPETFDVFPTGFVATTGSDSIFTSFCWGLGLSLYFSCNILEIMVARRVDRSKLFLCGSCLPKLSFSYELCISRLSTKPSAQSLWTPKWLAWLNRLRQTVYFLPNTLRSIRIASSHTTRVKITHEVACRLQNVVLNTSILDIWFSFVSPCPRQQCGARSRITQWIWNKEIIITNTIFKTRIKVDTK